jgi:FixJ family two-component response regulator
MTKLQRPTVFIVDDEPAVRESLALLLDVRGVRTESFAEAKAFLAAYHPSQPGCLLLDLRMPEMTGAELQDELAARGLTLPVVVITAHGDVAATRAAFKAGAVDFLEKPIDPDALLAAVDAALARDAELRERAERSGAAASKLDLLTGREREVVERAAAGLHNREIAAELGISARTVEVYKGRAMEKLGVRRLPDLVRLVMRSQGVVE